MTETATEFDVRELARGIAADIRQYGHYQESRDPFASLHYDDGEQVKAGKCCLVVGPTASPVPLTSPVFTALAKALGAQAGALSTYSDNTPTDVLLAQLDAIANGETTK